MPKCSYGSHVTVLINLVPGAYRFYLLYDTVVSLVCHPLYSE